MSVAEKNLFQERTRLFIGLGGVAIAITLILVLVGAYNGSQTIYRSYFVNSGADVWVAKKGWNDFHSLSLLPEDLGNKISRVNGVKSVDSIVMVQALGAKINGKAVGAAVVGFDSDSGTGGPWKMVEGVSSPGKDEVVVDNYLARKYGLTLGDSMEVAGRKFRIVGISDETNFVIYQLIFMPKTQA